MVSEETIVSCFSNLACNVPNKAVIIKCLQLCRTYKLDEEMLVELWVGYSVTHFLNFDPTVESLTRMENDELKKGEKLFVGKNDYTVNPEVYNVDSVKDTNDCDNILDVYTADQPSTSKQTKRLRSPGAEIEKDDSKLRAVQHTFVPSTYTSKPNTPSRGPSTTVRGKILLYFGPDVRSWRKENDYKISILKSDSPHVPKDAVYMYEMLSKQGNILSTCCESFGERLCHLWNDSNTTKSNIRYIRNVVSVSQIPFRTWGRVCTAFDKSAGTKMVILEGCKRFKGYENAPTIRMDLNGLKHYSIFPGQIIAVEGVNSVGNALVAKEIFSKGYAPIPEVPKLTQDLRLYVAVGPFTPSDNLNYQPLWDLMERVAEEEPDILILVGPFIEYTHSEIKKGALKDSYHDLFEKIVTKIMQFLEGKSTRVVLVPSNRDAHHDPVFPTPEFVIPPNKVGSDSANLCSMPDPCVINVEGLHIGITSVDSVKHLGQQEVSNTPGMDRLGRLADHVLSQATFYPLYPPFAGLNLDTTLWKKYACFEQQPHVMILPSDIRYYCKVVNECLVLNPERLQKYIYAKLFVRATGTSNGNWDSNNISCEIAKV